MIANRSYWGAVPFSKFGVDFPERRLTTFFKREGGENMQVLKTPIIVKHDVHSRPIYMVDTIAALKRVRLKSDVIKLNVIMLKPMRTKKSFNAIFRSLPWMDDRIVSFWGV